MKLYTYDPAPNPRRLTLFMQYKGIELDTQQVDLGTAEQLGDEYRKINPECSVPALVLDDGTKAQIISWDHRLFANVFSAIASILRNRSKAMVNRALPGPLDVPQIPELVERGNLQLGHILPKLNSELSDRPWLAGDNFSFADIDLLVCVDFMAWVKHSIPEDCSHLRSWYDSAKAELGL
jgi:glutathione S-transferase